MWHFIKERTYGKLFKLSKKLRRFYTYEPLTYILADKLLDFTTFIGTIKCLRNIETILNKKINENFLLYTSQNLIFREKGCGRDFTSFIEKKSTVWRCISIIRHWYRKAFLTKLRSLQPEAKPRDVSSFVEKAFPYQRRKIVYAPWGCRHD